MCVPPLLPRLGRWGPLLLAAVLWLPGRVRGGTPELEAGRPFLQSFGPRDYHAHNQNWAAAQDGRGVLYFGNNGVVLEYDGVSWRKLPVPGTTFVRGLAFDPASDAVFVGAVDQLGYLRADPDGGRTFVSLLDRLPADARDFRDIRRVYATAAGEIFFVADSQVMRWRAGRFTVWRPGNTERPHGFLVDGRFYLHSHDLGLSRLDGDSFVPVAPGADFLRANRVTVLLPGAAPGELLAGTEADGFWTLAADGRAAPFPTGADGFLRAHKLRLGRKLPDGTLALATVDGGLVWLGADGRFLGRLDEATGLPRDQILDLSTDREGGLWLGLNSGSARVELSGALSLFDEYTGLPRTGLNDLARVDGTLFLATDNGLYRLAPAEPGPAARPARCERVGDGELWTVCPDGVGGVLAASTDAVYRRGPDGRIDPLLGPGVQPRVLTPSRRDPARVWAGMRDGLRSLRREGGGWRDEGLVPGLAEEVRTIVETADGAVWFGTPTRGVFRVTFAETRDGSRGQATVRRYFKTDGLPEDMGWTGVLPWHDGADVIFATQAGLFRHDAAADRFLRVTDYGERLGNGTFIIGQLAEDAAGGLWVSGRSRQGVWLDQELGRAERGGRWEPLPGRIADKLGELTGILPEIGPDGAGVVWIFGSEGLARVVTAPRGKRAADGGGPAFGTHLRRAFTTNGPLEPLAPGGGGALPWARNSVRFEFAADTFRYGADVRYQTRLDGLPPGGWSEFSTRTGVDYTNLPAGSYTFHVRGRDADGHLGREAVFAWRVLPPWSRTLWAWAGYGLLGALLVVALVRGRLVALRRANARLEARVARQTGELIRARDTAEAANRAKSSFLANMSHELRTPLNAVLGYTQILLKDAALTAKNRERLGVVARSGEHLLGMINEVLDLSKIEAGTVALEPADFLLVPLLDSAAEAFRPRAAEKRIAFTLRRDADLPAAVHGDEGKLRQVLCNLLGNAVKFTARGAVELRVARAGADRLSFEVRDTGIGIPAGELADIFLSFHQAAGSGHAAEGTGLGLAISQRLVALLGGELRVESRLGVGSRFWFEIPLREAAGAAPAPVRPAALPGAAVTGYHGPRRRLLVVDDDATNRHVLRELLTPLGFEVEECVGGDECLARCARAPRPDAVLLDLRMPGKDGFDAARALRRRPEGAGLKIIAVSASVFASDRQQALDAGCDDFLSKPCAEETLHAALGHALGLDWVTAPAAPGTAATADGPGEALNPPAGELEALLELSRRGDVLKIRRRLADLLATDPRYAGFVEPLAALAAAYQMNRLRDALLERRPAESLETLR